MAAVDGKHRERMLEPGYLSRPRSPPLHYPGRDHYSERSPSPPAPYRSRAEPAASSYDDRRMHSPAASSKIHDRKDCDVYESRGARRGGSPGEASGAGGSRRGAPLPPPPPLPPHPLHHDYDRDWAPADDGRLLPPTPTGSASDWGHRDAGDFRRSRRNVDGNHFYSLLFRLEYLIGEFPRRWRVGSSCDDRRCRMEQGVLASGRSSVQCGASAAPWLGVCGSSVQGAAPPPELVGRRRPEVEASSAQ